MNRKELIAKLVKSGLEEASATTVADEILKQHSDTVEARKAETEKVQEELKAEQAKNKELTSEVSTLTSQVTEAQKVQESLEKVQGENKALKETINGHSTKLAEQDIRYEALKSVMSLHPQNADTVMKLMDLSTVSTDKDVAPQVEAIAKSLQETQPYLFKEGIEQGGYNPAKPQGGKGTEGAKPDSKPKSLAEQIEQTYTQQMETRQGNTSNQSLGANV